MRVTVDEHDSHASWELGPQVQLEIRRDGAKLAQRTRLELADALTRDAEAGTNLLERLRRFPVEAEAQRDDAAHAWIQPEHCLRQLLAAQLLRRRLVGTLRMDVLDQVGVHALAVADGRLEADRVFNEVEKLLHALLGEAAFLRELGLRRLAVQLLCELAARAHEP